MRLGFIGFGGAAWGLAKGLGQAGLADKCAFDAQWQSDLQGPVIVRRAEETGTVLTRSMAELVDRVDIVISCVTGAAALAVARAAAPHLTLKHLYVDVNTAAPQVMEDVAGVVESGGAHFVDVAMMGGIPDFLHRVPCLASGNGVERLIELMQPYGMDITAVGDKPGQASAIKLFRSVFMKGLLALLIETLTATHHYQVDDLVLDSLAKTMDRNPFLETVRQQLTKGVVNTGRMAHEMEDVVETLGSMGYASGMAAATRDKLQWCSGFEAARHFAGEFPDSLDEVLAFLVKKSVQ